MANQNEVVRTANQQVASLRKMLEDNKAQMTMALPKHMDADKMVRIALTSARRTPKLLECTPASFLGAVIQAAQLGLYVDGVLGHAYLVPYYNNKARRLEVQLIPGYKGLIDLARRSGHVDAISARVVYANDDFDFAYGVDEYLRHKPSLDNPGDPRCVYAIARLKDSAPAIEVMGVMQINAIRDSSQGYQSAVKFSNNDSPWIKFWDEMARKTIIRRLCKYLPLSPELQLAVSLDETADRGASQGLDLAIGDDGAWALSDGDPASALLDAFDEADRSDVTRFIQLSAKAAGCDESAFAQQALDNLDGFTKAFVAWRAKQGQTKAQALAARAEGEIAQQGPVVHEAEIVDEETGEVVEPEAKPGPAARSSHDKAAELIGRHAKALGLSEPMIDVVRAAVREHLTPDEAAALVTDLVKQPPAKRYINAALDRAGEGKAAA